MPSLPIPLIGALILGFLLIKMWFVDRKHGPLAALLALCAVQGLILSLAQHYRVPGFLILQPITATLIPATAWVAFQTTAVRRFARTDLVHLAGPAAALLCLIVQPYLLDALIPTLFVGYGLAIFMTSARGPDALPRMRLDAGELPMRIWQIIACALVASALSDGLIIAAQLADMAWLQPWIISLYSTGSVLLIGGLSLSGALENTPAEVDETPQEDTSAMDAQIMGQLEALMQGQRLYLNPDLTLSQMSRKLRVPVKQLSGAINRITGDNVSRYINAARIGAAQEAMLLGENVTNAMLSAGFNTKSNFNREFLRVTGMPPSEWLRENS